MGRPLSTTPKPLSNGKWHASLPVARGAKKRVSCDRFPDEVAANRWIADGIEALKSGRRVPKTDPYCVSTATGSGRPSAKSKVAAPPTIAEVAWAWHHDNYEIFRRGDLERAEGVRGVIDNHILPFFGPRLTTVADLDDPVRGPELCTQFAQHLAAQDAATPAPTAMTDGGSELLDASAAAARFNSSVSTVNRRRRDGKLTAAATGPNGELLYRSEDLQQVLGARGQRAYGLRRSYATEVLRVLNKILGYARARAWLTRDPMHGVSAIEPDAAKLRTPDPESPVRPITFRECRALAAHLPVLHQGVLFLLRTLGLRIGEAYGIRVRDVSELEDRIGVVLIEKQGGRTYLQRDEQGRFTRTSEKKKVKTETSYRLLVVPEPLMDLIKALVRAFHTDPETGEIDRDARLIPGLMVADESGQSAFRTALDTAAEREQMAFKDLGFKITPHVLRKSLSTDLSYEGGTGDLVIKRILGHVAGHDVLSRHYILNTPDLAPLKKAAQTVTKQIRDEVGTLITPTTQPIRFASREPDGRCEEYSELVLNEVGWRTTLSGEDELCDTARVAAELGIAPTTARRWMREGRLPTHVVAIDGVSTRLALLRDVRALAMARESRPSLNKVAADLGMSYHEAWTTIRRLRTGAYLEADDLELTDADIEALRSEHERVNALHRRAMKVHEAAKTLGTAQSTLYLWIRSGRLDTDPETDSSGAKFVNRDDVAALASTPTTPKQPGDTMSLPDLRQLTGLPDRHLRDLVRAGHLKTVPYDRRVAVTTESVLRWARGYRPDLLRKLD